MNRAAIGRLGDAASARAAQALAGVDRVRAAAWSRPRAHDLGAPPDAVLAVVAHWRPDAADAAGERLTHLERCVAALMELDAPQVVAVVLTNRPEPTARELGVSVPVRVVSAGAVGRDASAPREVLVVGFTPRLPHRHGFYLTWAHVPLLRAAARTGRFSHLLYLEDDMRFTDGHLGYWCRYRGPLAELGLLPGFVRFERRGGERYLVDALRPVDPAARRREVRVDGETVRFVNLANPYQALYILDRDLAEWHFRYSRGRSPLRSRTSEWRVRERAASGPIFDHVPAGLVSRNVVPVTMGGGRQQLDPSCLVEHMAATQSASGGPFGVLRAEELFAAEEGL
jgi:hypothetical protein